MDDWFEYKQKIEDQQRFQEIENAHKLTIEMYNEAKKYTKLADLALSNEIQVMKDSLRCRWMDLSYPVRSAQKWLSMRTGKLDGRKKYDEKNSFDTLTHNLEDLLGTKIEINSISYSGYDESEIFINFKLLDDSFIGEFELDIPDIEKLNKDNLEDLDYGKLKILVRRSTTSACWDFVGDSYDRDELKSKFNEFISRNTCKMHVNRSDECSITEDTKSNTINIKGMDR